MTAARSHDRRRAVLFDLGGVVCQFSHEQRLSALAGASGLSTTEVHGRLFASGFDLDCDRGVYSLEGQCGQICARLDIAYTEHGLAELWAQAFAPNADVLAIVHELRSRAKTAILTNNGPLVDLMLRELFSVVDECFDHLCFSYEAKSVRPEPRAFVATVERLGFRPEQCAFIDEAEKNVEGARNVGIDAVRFVSAPLLATFLQERQLI